MYNVFGLGASHAIYAQLMAQSALAKEDRKCALSEVLWNSYGSMVLCHDASYSSSATIECHYSLT